MGRKKKESVPQRQDYLANCFEWILTAECAAEQRYRQMVALADIVRVAAREGLNAAHRQLVELAGKAREGEFAGVKKPHLER